MTTSPPSTRMKPWTIPWLEGRHGTAAIIAVLGSVVCAWLLCLYPQVTLAIPVYVDRICFPDPTGTPYIENALYVGCPRGTVQDQMVVPLGEILCVSGISASLVFFSPLMPFWEGFDRHRAFVGYAIAAAMSFILPIGSALLAGTAFSTSTTGTIMLITTGNIFIDSTLVFTGMALLGKFYGLGLGALLAVVNLLTQNLQTPTGLAFRLYSSQSATAIMPTTSTVITLAILINLSMICMWSCAGGRGILHRLT